jgi:hypothetical protein
MGLSLTVCLGSAVVSTAAFGVPPNAFPVDPVGLAEDQGPCPGARLAFLMLNAEKVPLPVSGKNNQTSRRQ